MRVICHTNSKKIKDDLELKKSQYLVWSVIVLVVIVICAFVGFYFSSDYGYYNQTIIWLCLVSGFGLGALLSYLLMAYKNVERKQAFGVPYNVKLFENMIRGYKHKKARVDFNDNIVIFKFTDTYGDEIKCRMHYDDVERIEGQNVVELHIYEFGTVLQLKHGISDYSTDIFEFVSTSGSEWKVIES